MVRSAKRRPRRLSGLTLVEMLIVLVLAVVLITVVLAVIWGGDARKVRTEAQRMAAYFQSAAAEAVMRDGPARVQVAIAEASYHRQVAELSAKVGVPNWSDDENAKKESVQKPVELRELMLPIAGSMKAGTGWVAWNGRKTDGGVAVLGLNEAVYSVVVDPNSGEIRIEKGRVEIPGLMDAPKRKPVKKPLMPLESMGDFSPGEVAEAAKDLQQQIDTATAAAEPAAEQPEEAAADTPEDLGDDGEDEAPEEDVADDPDPEAPPPVPQEEPEPEPEEEEEDIGCGPLMEQVDGRCVPRPSPGGGSGAIFLGLSVAGFNWQEPEFIIPDGLSISPESSVETAIEQGDTMVVEIEVNLETGTPSAYFGQARRAGGVEVAWSESYSEDFGEPPTYPKWTPIQYLGSNRFEAQDTEKDYDQSGASRWRFLESEVTFAINLGSCVVMLPLKQFDLRMVVVDGRFSSAQYELSAVLVRADMREIALPRLNGQDMGTLDEYFRADDMTADANGDGHPDGWFFRAEGNMFGAVVRPPLRTYSEGFDPTEISICQ